jgi:hypothetical protein
MATQFLRSAFRLTDGLVIASGSSYTAVEEAVGLRWRSLNDAQGPEPLLREVQVWGLLESQRASLLISMRKATATAICRRDGLAKEYTHPLVLLPHDLACPDYVVRLDCQFKRVGDGRRAVDFKASARCR